MGWQNDESSVCHVLKYPLGFKIPQNDDLGAKIEFGSWVNLPQITKNIRELLFSWFWSILMVISSKLFIYE